MENNNYKKKKFRLNKYYNEMKFITEIAIKELSRVR